MDPSPARRVHASVTWVRDLDLAGRYDLLCRAAVRQAQTTVALSHTSSLVLTGQPPLQRSFSTRGAPDATGREGGATGGWDLFSTAATLVEGDLVEHNGLLVTSVDARGLGVHHPR